MHAIEFKELMRDSNANLSKRKDLKKDSAIFDIVEFGSSSRVSVLYNIVHCDNTGYFSLVDHTPKVNDLKSKRKHSTRKSK